MKGVVVGMAMGAAGIFVLEFVQAVAGDPPAYALAGVMIGVCLILLWEDGK